MMKDFLIEYRIPMPLSVEEQEVGYRHTVIVSCRSPAPVTDSFTLSPAPFRLLLSSDLLPLLLFILPKLYKYVSQINHIGPPSPVFQLPHFLLPMFRRGTPLEEEEKERGPLTWSKDPSATPAPLPPSPLGSGTANTSTG